MAKNSIRSNYGPNAGDRRDQADGKAQRRKHSIEGAVAASTGQAGLEQGNQDKKNVEESDGS